MSRSFAPSFQHFQKDVERYLKSKGQVEKNEHGQTVYRGYQAELARMFRTYIDKEAFAPLVAEFRKWNWEWSYDEHLLELTSRLHEKQRLAAAQGALGRRRCEAQNQLQQDQEGSEGLPDKIPEELVTKTQDLLLESLYRLQRYASELGHESEVGEYVEMIARVEKRLKA